MPLVSIDPNGADSSFENLVSRGSRGDEAQVSLETEGELEPPHVVSCFIDGLPRSHEKCSRDEISPNELCFDFDFRV